MRWSDPPPRRWVAAAVVVLLAAMLAHSLFFSHVVVNGRRRERFEWNIINQYFLSSEILKALGVTIALTVVAMAGGIAIGVTLAIMRLSPTDRHRERVALYLVLPGTRARATSFLVQRLLHIPEFLAWNPFGPALVHFNSTPG